MWDVRTQIACLCVQVIANCAHRSPWRKLAVDCPVACARATTGDNLHRRSTIDQDMVSSRHGRATSSNLPGIGRFGPVGRAADEGYPQTRPVPYGRWLVDCFKKEYS